MRSVLVTCALVATLCGSAAQAVQPLGHLEGMATYLGSSRHFVELRLAGTDLVCANGARTDISSVVTGQAVRFSGTFANYAGLYEQVMMVEDCDVKPATQNLVGEPRSTKIVR